MPERYKKPCNYCKGVLHQIPHLGSGDVAGAPACDALLGVDGVDAFTIYVAPVG